MTTNPTVNDNFSQNEFGPGEFSEDLHVIPDTTYYIKAYASNSKGTSYGVEVQFNTSSALPQLETLNISEITTITAQGGGNITFDGGMSIIARGVCWSTTPKPTIFHSKTDEGVGKGLFVSNLTDLSPNQTYYARAYATNLARTAYGNEVSFMTLTALPNVTTSSVINISTTTANTGGIVTNDGGSNVTDRGVCWSTSQNPTIVDNKTIDGTGVGAFTSHISDLTEMTTYYVRAYATNAEGTNYGEEVSFSTLEATSGTFTDQRDSRTYKWLMLGTQIWMAENLAFLPAVSPASIGSTTEPVYYVYNYQGSNITEAKTTSNYINYGALYNWEASLTVCPAGWHLPSGVEWTILTEYLTNNGYGYGGSGNDVAKSMASKSGWSSHSSNGRVGNDQSSNNSSGFTALPGGVRHANGSSGFVGLANGAYFWSSTVSNMPIVIKLLIYFTEANPLLNEDDSKQGQSVRCIKNL